MQLHKPNLTTIRQDTRRIGGLAASRLIGQIDGIGTIIPEIVAMPGVLLPDESVWALKYS